MSHGKERAEKICLNCGNSLYGRYCHACGQENIEPKESFVGLVSHFFNDITHFDGKFFTTVKHLVTKPGKLPADYIQGKRSRYLHPIRMYVFTSAFFFFIFYNFYSPDALKIGIDSENIDSTAIATGRQALQTDSLSEEETAIVNNSISQIEAMRKKDSVGGVLKTAEQYLEEQEKLSKDERDSWLISALTAKNYQLKNTYKNNPEKMKNAITDKFLHTFPYILFVSLPLFALFLKLIYSKKFYFTDHIMFLIYLYIFSFLLTLFIVAGNQLANRTGMYIFGIINTFIFISGLVYTYFAMKNFYRQSYGMTFLKYVIFNTFSTISTLILFLLFLLITLFLV